MRHSKKHSRRRKARSRGDQQSQQLEPRLLLTSVLGDFNGDGHNDLATGIPHEDVGRVADAGTVLVRYGTGYGLTGPTETWNGRNIDGLSVATDDQFGASLTVGDFDGNGVDDLAIGVPNRDVSGIRDAGAVAVVYGYRHGMFGAGLSPYRTQTFFQGVDGLADKPEMLDRFGTTLAAGDFTGDGNDELVVGVPSESFVTDEQPAFDTFEDAGAVHVIQGGSRGLHTANDQFWTPGQDRVLGMTARYNRFGSSFAVGDFGGSGHVDLAIGAPGETIGGQPSAGGVHVLYSRASGDGLSGIGNQWFHQNSPRRTGVSDTVEAYDSFGSSLVAADFNNDGRHDLAIGVPGEDARSGAVHVLLTERGRRGRLSLNGNRTFRESDLGGIGQSDDLFGYSLASRYNGYREELLVGIPGDSSRFVGRSHGAIAVVRPMHHPSAVGRPGQKITNRTAGDRSGDFWGSTLVAGQLNGNADYFDGGERHREDLIVGIPGDDVSGIEDAGSLQILVASRFGALGLPSAPVSQRSLSGVSAEAGDQFGGSIPLELRDTYTEDAIPHLESNPGARRTVYLDFNGHSVDYLLDRRDHASPGFTLDLPVSRSDGAYWHINATEAAMIEDIWATVAEDFAAFDVNVTTHEPESGRFDRVAIGGPQPSWQDGGPGVHRWYEDETTWVWPESFNGFSNPAQVDLAVHIGNVASHEQGHVLDICHKSERGIVQTITDVAGRTVYPETLPISDPRDAAWYDSEYSPGDPNWNPIMGTAYNSQRTIWTQAVMDLEDRVSEGPSATTPGVTVTTTRVAIRTSGFNEIMHLQRELGLRADDHGDSVDAATLMTSSIAVGNIETANDTDVFILDVSPGGTFSVDVDVAEVAPNLDLALSVFELSESGDVRVTQPRIEPIDRLGASSSLLTLTPSADRIVVMVSSRGDLVGDIGTYTVRTTFMPAPPLRRLTRTIATPVPGTSFAPLASRSMSYTAMPAASDKGLRSTSSFTQKATLAFSLPQADAEPVSLSVDNLTKPKPQQPSVTAKGTPEPDMLQGLAIEKAFVDFEVQLEPVFNKV